jgi:3-oxoacyl-ACP reductase-like protein
MDQFSMVAQEIETHRVRTFSAKEMAFNILGLMHPIVFSITQIEPFRRDLSGGFGRIADLADMANRIRVNIKKG